MSQRQLAVSHDADVALVIAGATGGAVAAAFANGVIVDVALVIGLGIFSGLIAVAYSRRETAKFVKGAIRQHVEVFRKTRQEAESKVHPDGSRE